MAVGALAGLGRVSSRIARFCLLDLFPVVSLGVLAQ